MKKNLLKNSAVQTLVASLICIVLGLFLGYLVLLLINPVGAGDAILTVIKNFWTYNRQASQVKYLGNTLVKTAPLLMCALSVRTSRPPPPVWIRPSQSCSPTPQASGRQHGSLSRARASRAAVRTR